MLKEDWENNADKCSRCGADKAVICKCEVSNFREDEARYSDDSDGDE